MIYGDRHICSSCLARLTASFPVSQRGPDPGSVLDEGEPVACCPPRRKARSRKQRALGRVAAAVTDERIGEVCLELDRDVGRVANRAAWMFPAASDEAVHVGARDNHLVTVPSLVTGSRDGVILESPTARKRW